jgi:purine-binding chemotaxis protein CheW
VLNQLLAFSLDRQRYALRLGCVQRVVRAVEVTPLPKAPEIVLGVVNVQGKIIPVFNLRKRFGLRERETNLSDQLVIAHAAGRSVALVVDSVMGLLERSKDEITETEEIVPGAEHVEGVAKLHDGILFIHNLDRFLSLDEEKRLESLLAGPQAATQ